jgi:hypothetical protein
VDSLGKYSGVVIIILGVILLVGYIGPLPLKPSIGMAQQVSPLTAPPSVQEDTAYFIQIYSIRDHFIGESIPISGLTNIPDGEQIHLQIYTDEFYPERSQRIDSKFTVERPHLSEGPWEVRADARSFPAGRYFLEVFRESDPKVRTSGQFRILNPESLWMTIVSPGPTMMGDGFTINAETNLPAGDTIHILITERPEKNPQDGYGTWEPEGNTTVNRNIPVRNTWSYSLAATPPAHPANYSILACSVNYPGICAWKYFDLIPAAPRPSTSSLAG